MHPNFQDPARTTTLRNRTRSGSQGLDVRNSSPSNAQGDVFFLDIPFYRTLYDVVGSVKRHVECTSCGRLVFVLTYKGLCSFLLHSDQGSLSKSSGGIWFHQPSIRSGTSDHDSFFRRRDRSREQGAQSA